jgi:hypothetical protein
MGTIARKKSQITVKAYNFARPKLLWSACPNGFVHFFDASARRGEAYS